jgi:hypothetical protein
MDSWSVAPAFPAHCRYYCLFIEAILKITRWFLKKQSKPQYNQKTQTDHSVLIARTLPLSNTLRDKIPKATMKITDLVKPP